ncbi:MAG: ASPIC/UnbV domain-containing protein, partial [Planctomycetales bacterium]|nr:ASPIC/UnbV domain-containing protein [Planctomycetales bacterium]
YGVLVTELNGDEYCDIVLAQNFYTPQVETGRMDGGVGLVLLGTASGEFVPQLPARSGLVVPEDAKSAVVTDLNADGLPDVLMGTNNDAAQAFVNQAAASDRFVVIRPDGSPGNPTGIGTRITLRLEGGTQQTAEVYAGSGYLSQSSPAIWFGTRGKKVER